MKIEIAHMRVSYHDEEFVGEVEKIRARTHLSPDEYSRIGRLN